MLYWLIMTNTESLPLIDDLCHFFIWLVGSIPYLCIWRDGYCFCPNSAAFLGFGQIRLWGWGGLHSQGSLDTFLQEHPTEQGYGVLPGCYV